MSNQAIAQILEREVRALAQEMADATDYEAAGIMLRVATYPSEIIHDRMLATTAHSLITEARDVSGFTKFRKRLDDIRFSFDNAVRNMV